jgi:calcium/calmodulin-dependent protein kinase I
MHKQGIMHRDLKPDNILLKNKDPHDYELKIADFGFSCHYREGHKKKEMCGT